DHGAAWRAVRWTGRETPTRVLQPGWTRSVAHTFTSSSSTTRSPLKTACFAPGTPYSYGPPTTCGISSKLKTGGGELTCHSSVCARHGFGGAGAPRVHETIML